MDNATRDEIIARHIMTPAGKRQLAPYVLRPIGLAFGFHPEDVELAIQAVVQRMHEQEGD